MPQTRVVLYRGDDGRAPLLDWLDEVPPRVSVKCIGRVERLRALGHELRRPEADFLRDGVYELRVGFRGKNYRMLYFFHGGMTAVVSHGIVKERIIPPAEIDRAIEFRRRFLQDPRRHSQEVW